MTTVTRTRRDPFGVYEHRLPVELADRVDELAAPVLGPRSGATRWRAHQAVRERVGRLVSVWSYRQALERQEARLHDARQGGLLPAGDELDETQNLIATFSGLLDLENSFALQDGCGPDDVQLAAGRPIDQTAR